MEYREPPQNPPEKTEQQLRAFLAERGIATYPQRMLVIPPNEMIPIRER